MGVRCVLGEGEGGAESIGASAGVFFMESLHSARKIKKASRCTPVPNADETQSSSPARVALRNPCHVCHSVRARAHARECTHERTHARTHART